MSADPVANATETARVGSQPSDIGSAPLQHNAFIVSQTTFADKGKSKAKEPQDVAINEQENDQDDLVVFDSNSIAPSVHMVNADNPNDQHDAKDSFVSKHSVDFARTSVESLSFNYRDHLLPLSLSGDGDESWEAGDYEDVEGVTSNGGRRRRTSRSPSLGGRRRNRDIERKVTLIDGIALTVGVQIGSGIFSSPGVVTLNTGSIGASLVVWLVSGILAWTGASSFAELGASIPLNGGSQAYLNYSFGPMMAFLYTWTALVALKPGGGAIIATIFGEYVARMIFHATTDSSEHPHEKGLDGIPSWSIKLIACLIATIITIVHAFSNKLGTRTQIATTSVKIIALAAVPVLAIIQTARGKMSPTSAYAFKSLGHLFEGSSTNPSAYALALYSGLWAFDGWDQSCFVAGEMKKVERDLPRVIHSSLSIVVAIFLLTVTSYFMVLPPELVKKTNTVALDFGSAIFGTTGGIVFAFLVAFSCFGALNGQVYTTARLILAASREGYLLSLFGDLNRRTKTPLAALSLQLLLIILFIVFGSGFASLVNFYGVCSWFFYLATVLGLLILRIKEPHLERPYQTWLSTPILFAAVALFLLFMPMASAPLEGLAALGFISAGVPVYFATQHKARTWIPGLSFLARLFGQKESPSRPAHDDNVSLDPVEEGTEEEAMEMLPRTSDSNDEKVSKHATNL